MKLRDPKTGKEFEDIYQAIDDFCIARGFDCDTYRTCIIGVYARKFDEGCIEYAEKNPTEAARLMGLQVIESEEESEDGVQIREKVKTKVKEDSMEKRDEPATQKPRLAEVLGVEVGEKFRVDGAAGEFWVESDGGVKSSWVKLANPPMPTYILYAINHPESIIRAPRLTETERIFLQGIPGVKWVSRGVNADDGYVDLWGAKPELIEGCYNGPQGIGVIGRISSGLCISVHPGDCIEV